MVTFIIGFFILGYLFIALEHVLKIDKGSSALITGAVCWTCVALGGSEFASFFDERLTDKISSYIINPEYHDFVKYELGHHLKEIGEILFFLLGAMTIVELIDSHKGFKIITDRITTRSRIGLLWVLCIVAFFFSAVLDNLTAAIVMGALLTKLFRKKQDLWFFGGMIIIAANAGGAWSPIGDVTTIMLWIGKQVTAANIITSIIIPSVVCMIVPLIIVSLTMKRNQKLDLIEEVKNSKNEITTVFERNLIFCLGVLGLLFVPVFKIITHLPPYTGMLFSLGILWLVTEVLHKNKPYEIKSKLIVSGVVRKIDMPTIFFFLGILLAVSSLASIGVLNKVAIFLENTFSGDIIIINIIIGLLSAIIDNVPLVAGAMQMYEVGPVGPLSYPQDHAFWEFLAYCAGTGGSVLIIGSAAGVAIMGILKIDFLWYLRKIAFLALIGYLSGALCYWVLNKNELSNQKQTTEIEIENQIGERSKYICKL